MDFNLVSNIEHCFIVARDSSPLTLVYYSHITSIIISLIIGFFVFIRNKQSLAAKVLLSLSLTFSMWVFFNLILWTSYNSEAIMFFWSLSGILIMLMFWLGLYLTYIFIDQKDTSFLVKLLTGLLFLPIIFLTPTDFNISAFSIINDCEATEGQYFSLYYYLFGSFVFLWILILSVVRYRSAKGNFKKQIALFSFGIEFFVLSFFVSGYIASLTGFYELEFYGILSMAVFMAFISYLIVRFNAFNIKLLGTQALVIVLVILIGAQFFYVKTRTNFILTTVTFLLVVAVGILLIRSFKKADERKEQLQLIADKLAISNEKLREMDNAKTEFISIASHQLRTPLTAIKGYTSLMLEGSYGKIDPAVQDILHKMYMANDRLINLVENLLNISRMEAGRMQYKFEETSLKELLSEVYESFEFASQNKNLSLTLNLAKEELPLFSLDKQKMHEVFSNLVDNAIKYTNEGGVDISLVYDSTTKKARVIVKDSGIGVPKSEVPFLFAKFSRGKDTVRLHANGTGLGLYVVKSIVEAHKGKVWVESEGEGKGTSFIVELG